MTTSPPSATRQSANVLDWSRAAWSERFRDAGIKPVHAKTAWGEVYRRLNTDLQGAPALPSSVRHRISEFGWTVDSLRIERVIESRDGFTRKYLLGLADGEVVETVLMHFRGRATACVSTQVGCAMGCVFCATGQNGFRRHLNSGEIVAQVVHVARVLRMDGHRLRNVVLMGQGEPLHNYEATMAAIDVITDCDGLALAGERITLSTVGLVPGIQRLAEERRVCSLAVSLHGATDEDRGALVPIAKRWPLAELMAACREYSRITDRHIFFEWTLIEGRNDDEHTAHALGKLLAEQRAHVNLIPLNPTAGFSGAPTATSAARAFQQVLRGYGIPSTVRQRRGIDIAAGCGQLAGTTRPA